MKTEITIAVISASVALISAIITIFGQMRTARLQARLQHERDDRIKEEQAQKLLTKYREPLAQAAFELQSKLYNILKLDLLETYYFSENPNEKEYAVQNTLYVIGQYFAWHEIIRREVQFLDLGAVGLTRKLAELNEQIVVSFLDSGHGPVFRIFRGEQRAIAEKMILADNDKPACIGYASFVEAQDQEFRKWFRQLEKDIAHLSEDLTSHSQRLQQLQHALIDLLDYLDPDYIRFGAQYRTKV
jgi:hypothetical protein